MDEDIFFDKGIHVNRLKTGSVKVGVDEETGEDKFELFDLESDTFKHLQDNLIMSFDGTIMGVKRSAVEHLLNDPDIRKIRYGVTPMPRNFKIENEDDFYKMLAILTPLSEA